MTPERWQKIRELFHATIERNMDERVVYLAAACAADPSLQADVEKLISSHERAPRFLEPTETTLPAAESPTILESGQRVGHYQVVEAIGQGGMGVVYKAEDSRLGRLVALKFLPSAVARDPQVLARFEREARLLAALNHPNVGAIYGFEEAEGVRCLVLELVEGPTLADRLSAGPVPMPEALAIARQIADALDAAHEKGIVHRDLKPANIKIAPNGLVKVLDFGLAKASAGDGSGKDLSVATAMKGATREGIIIGTAAYMSPEQARGRPFNKRMDIWAFGCVLYELFTGRLAFPGETVSDTIVAILGHDPEWGALPESTPDNIRRLLHRCLEKDPKQRVRDIGDARLEIDDALSGAAEAPAAAPSAKTRSHLAWSIAAIAFVAAAVALGRVLWLESQSEGAPAFSRVVRFTTGPALDFGPAISPDGKWVAYLSNARGPTDVWVKFIAGGEPHNLTASTSLELLSQNDMGGLSVSPDGANIAFDAGATKGTPANWFDAWVIPAPLGGVPRKLVQLGRSVRWSPDGKKITYVRAGASAGDALFMADADGGNPHEIVAARGGMHVHYPAWSQDGRYLYFIYSISTSNSEPAEIYRVPASGGPIEPIITTVRRAVFPTPTPEGLIYAANPASAEVGLWWKSLTRRKGEARRLTSGIGEYAEPSIAADGRRLVATLVESRQSLLSLSLTGTATGDLPRSLTHGYSGDLDPVLSPDGTRLAFSSTRSGDRNLWTARPDGTEPRPLTSGTASDERLAFSPDGQRIAFVSDRGGQRGIWVMGGEGGAARLVVKAQVLDTLTWSSESRQIVYATPIGDAPGLWIATVDDGSVRRLPTPGPAVAPAWSPRGDVIAYLEPRRAGPNRPFFTAVAFVTPTGQPISKDLHQGMNLPNGFLAWAPDGRRLAAIANPGGSPSAVWIVEPESREPFRKLIEFPIGVRLRGATWSQDASSLVIGQTTRTSNIVLFEQGR